MPNPQRPSPSTASARLESALRAAASEKIELQLYIAGLTPKSTRALIDFQRLQQHLPDRCNVEVIDIYQQPERAIEAQIVAVPTLIRHGQGRLQRLIGSLAETNRILKDLGFVT